MINIALMEAFICTSGGLSKFRSQFSYQNHCHKPIIDANIFFGYGTCSHGATNPFSCLNYSLDKINKSPQE